MTRPFRWSILGTGAVSRKFVLDLAQLNGQAEAWMVASRSPENAKTFAADLGIPNATADFETAITADVDAVYIATPAALHHDHALAAIKAGRAVLIEKPLAPDAASAQSIAQAANAAGVFCMEAMWTRFLPVIENVWTHIRAGDLGELRGFDGRFMIANTPDASASIFDPDRAGGALLHRGIYPLSLARHFLGPVRDLKALANIGSTGVDEDTTIVLHHEAGGVSTLRCSLRAQGQERTEIYGTKATLYLEGPIYRPLGARLVPTQPMPATSGMAQARRLESFRESALGLRLIGALKHSKSLIGGAHRLPAGFKGNGYNYEARAVMEAVGRNDTTDPRMTLEESVEITGLMDQARTAWRHS